MHGTILHYAVRPGDLQDWRPMEPTRYIVMAKNRQPTGWISGIRWLLDLSHPTPEIVEVRRDHETLEIEFVHSTACRVAYIYGMPDGTTAVVGDVLLYPELAFQDYVGHA